MSLPPHLQPLSSSLQIDPDSFLKKWVEAKIEQREGSCVPDQMRFFVRFLMENKNIKNVLEIGFNAGLSAGVFLATRTDIKLVSVDIGAHDYILKAQKLIQKLFPDRFMLVVGDSSLVVPQLKDLISPDLIFIDGAHHEPVVSLDLKNCLDMCRPGTWLLIDDYWPKGDHEPAVKKAVDALVQTGKLVLLGQWSTPDRSWALGKKIF